MGREPAEQILTLGLAEIAGDAPSAPSLDGPEQGVTRAVIPAGLIGHRGERSDGPHEVADTRLLHLHDVRAPLSEQSGAERSSDPRSEVEHSQAVEGLRGLRPRRMPGRSW